MKDFTQSPRPGLTVIDGGKSSTPGETHTHSQPANQGASQGLPPGFMATGKPASMPGAISVIGPDGEEGELMEVKPGQGLPPELLMLMLMSMLARKSH